MSFELDLTLHCVRARILDEIARRLLAAGPDDGLALLVRSGDLNEEQAAAVARAVAQGWFCGELIVDHDTPDAEQLPNHDAAEFEVALIVHLPRLANPLLTPDRLASMVHASVQELYDTESKAQWADSLGPTAIRTTNLGGGGVIVDPHTGNNVTVSGFRVRYRTLRTDQFTPA